MRNFWYNFVFTFYVRSAVILDVVAISALIIYVTRVALGYKQTWDRYQVSQFNTPYVVLKMIDLNLFNLSYINNVLKEAFVAVIGQQDPL